jgi:predicted transcriptional regulator YdeE
MSKLTNPIHIIGIELRTTNDNGRAFQDIPPFWEKFIKENCAAQISNKLDNDIYAVYTHFENPGKNNHGMYSLNIGCSVPANTMVPKGYASVIIPAGNYRVFPVEKNRSDKVGEAWQEIWALPASEKQDWSFNCEFERYCSSGEIDIYIGTKG